SDDGGLLARVGAGSIAAGVAAFAIGFTSYMWLTRDSGSARAGLRAEVDLPTGTVGPDARRNAGMRLASAGNDFEFTFDQLDNQSQSVAMRSSFGERFAFDQSDPASDSGQSSSQRLASFDDRFSFSGEGPAPDATVAVAPRAKIARAAVAIPLPRAAVRP